MGSIINEIAPPALRCEGLTKKFGGLLALGDFSLDLKKGERRAIIGPNGAGKTTLYSLISGIYPVTSGSIYIFGRDISKLPAYRRTSLGLGRTFQVTTLFPELTVMDNLIIADMGLKKHKFSMLKPLSAYRDLHERSLETLENVGIAEKQNHIVKNLSYGEQRQIEVALALVSNPTVLLLDEPTAGLSAADTVMMTKMIHGLDPEITILIIEHNMDVALQVGKLITVLHMGRIFAEGNSMEIRNNPKVQEIYFGSGDESC